MASKLVTHFKCDACEATYDVEGLVQKAMLPTKTWQSLDITVSCLDHGSLTHHFDACSPACAGKLLQREGGKLTGGTKQP